MLTQIRIILQSQIQHYVQKSVIRWQFSLSGPLSLPLPVSSAPQVATGAAIQIHIKGVGKLYFSDRICKETQVWKNAGFKKRSNISLQIHRMYEEYRSSKSCILSDRLSLIDSPSWWASVSKVNIRLLS